MAVADRAAGPMSAQPGMCARWSARRLPTGAGVYCWVHPFRQTA